MSLACLSATCHMESPYISYISISKHTHTHTKSVSIELLVLLFYVNKIDAVQKQYKYKINCPLTFRQTGKFLQYFNPICVSFCTSDTKYF